MVPPGPFRMPSGSRDGLMRKRAGAIERFLHYGAEPVTARARIQHGAVRLRAEAPSRQAAAYGIERMRFALALDLDLRPFFKQFQGDELLGPVLRRRVWYRPWRSAQPWESLAWAICEQLIESRRAAEIQRRLIHRFGRRSGCGRLRDAPDADTMAGRSPAELEACDLAGKRAIAMVKAAREVASGRVDLTGEHEPARERLMKIPNIGAWTVEKLAWEGQGRLDQLPAGDLAYVVLVGSLSGLGRRATEGEVRAFFEPYAPYQAVAGMYLVRARHMLGLKGRRRAAARW